jgi:thiol-disulfide isomerase/thioredoxin
MKKILITSIMISLFLISVVSAMEISFYYSPECPHCQNVIPTINSLMNQYTKPCFIWKTFDTTQTSYDISGIPTIRIKTSDNRDIEIVGDTPILKQLPCELKQQSSPECITYPAESNHKGSWFING